MPGADFLIRQLVADSSGLCSIGVHGFGVEVIDGGTHERGNLLALARRDTDFDTPFTSDNAIACMPGARIAGEFDQLKLIAQDATAGETVLVKVITTPLAAWMDSEPEGKARIRWLSRGRYQIAGATGKIVYDSGTLGEPDRFSLREQLEVFNFWAGYIAGRQAFTVWVEVQPYNVAGATFQVQQSFASKNYSALPAGYSGEVPSGAAYAMDWTTETAGASGVLARYPIGRVKVYVLNDSGTQAQYTCMIGVRAL